jgi:hypothetical protein
MTYTRPHRQQAYDRGTAGDWIPGCWYEFFLSIYTGLLCNKYERFAGVPKVKFKLIDIEDVTPAERAYEAETLLTLTTDQPKILTFPAGVHRKNRIVLYYLHMGKKSNISQKINQIV